MKTKNKTLASIEIVIVLCSLFLVAIPAIAADQNQGMQKTNTITTASEDDYVLGIYGNANEDDSIDMGDVVYTKLAIFGKKPKTELCDAKYDGRINVLDVIQTKLIILGKEKEITVVDYANRTVTISKLIERLVVPANSYPIEAIRMLGEKDKIVSISKNVKRREVFFPEISKLPLVSHKDYEAILSFNPDLVITGMMGLVVVSAEKLPGIPVATFKFRIPADIKEEVMKLGYILGKKDKAEYYIDDFHDKYIDRIKERTEGLSEEERPKVYLERFKDYQTYGGVSYVSQMIDIAGGKNIFADVMIGEKGGGGIFLVDAEEVVIRNPDIIIRYLWTSESLGNAGYGQDDISQAKAIWDEIMNRPELANVNAVKNGDVYLIDMGISAGPGYPVAVAYWSKWVHPELFEDLDPKAIHQEYVTELQGLDFNVGKHGVFVYHPELYPDGR